MQSVGDGLDQGLTRRRRNPRAAFPAGLLQNLLPPVALAALALVVCSGTAEAVPLNTGQLAINPNFSGGAGPVDLLTNASGAIDLADATTGGFSSSGDATLHMNWGFIKMQGSAFGSLNTLTRGIFRDNVLITAPGVTTGTPGTLTFSLSLDGLLQPGSSGTGAAGYGLQADFGGGAFDINKSAHFNSPDLGGAFVGDPFGVYSATVSFVFGIAAPLDVELTGTAEAAFNADGPGSADYHLDNSLYWAGISDVKVGGVSVDAFTALGDSGTDWAKSFVPSTAPEGVPEPMSGLILGSGLLGLLLARRGQRAKR